MAWRYLCAIAACMFALPAGVEAKAHRLPKSTWQGSVAVAPDAPASVASKASPVCAQMTANTKSHVDKLQSLIIDVAKSRTAPPSTVFGTVKNMMGHRYVDKATKDKLDKLEGERRSVKELNAMLVSLHCEPVDVEHTPTEAPKADVPSPREIMKKIKSRDHS
jgi:hypothetical protein